MGPLKVQTLWVWVDLGVMIVKMWLHTSQISRIGASSSGSVYCHIQDRLNFLGGDTPFKGMQSAYSKTCQKGGFEFK